MQDALRQFKADFFQALAHPTRIAIVEQLREGELSAGTIIERLGIEQANASQHLAILRAKNILVNRKAGNQVFYSVRDRRIVQILDIMRQYFQAHMSEVLATLRAIDKADKVRR
jgi:DNA-binding transcriptional ArsR family regulator